MNDARACAACGVEGESLRRCCGETHYCNVACQKAHRRAHRKSCTNANSAKKRGEAVKASTALAVDDGYDFFGDDELELDLDLDSLEFPLKEDCPVCMYPLPADESQINYFSCCSSAICYACCMESTENAIQRGLDMDSLARCPFCRSPSLNDASEAVKNFRSHTERGDVEAILELAHCYAEGRHGVAIDNQKAFDLYCQAANAGSANAASALGMRYLEGEIVMEDKRKARLWLTKAVKGGCLASLHNLGSMAFHQQATDWDGCTELKPEVSSKFLAYYFKAAENGWKASMEQIRLFHELGFVSDDEHERTLKAHKRALEKEQSPSRIRWVKK